jgi:hypothetical protein
VGNRVSGWRPVAGSSEHGNEPSVSSSIKARNFLTS